jgi:tripartite-type tricarboxylate transporter receptor subunit TctC
MPKIFKPGLSFQAVIAAIFLSVSISTAHAQAYPSKPVRVVIPFPPGISDVIVRLMQPSLVEDLGQPLVIENRAGANAIIGTEVVARAAPDGYTFLITSSAIVAAPIMTGAPFDTLKDFTPITQFYRGHNVVAVRSTLPVNTIPELIEYAKKNPGKLSYATGGVGSLTQLETENFKIQAGVDIVHIPYKAFAAMAQAVVSHEADLAFFSLPNIRPFIASGKVRLLASYDGKRNAAFPGLPDLVEFLPEYRKSPSFFASFGPAGLPRPILLRLNGALVKAFKQPSVLEKIGRDIEVIANTPDEFAATLKADVETTRKMAAAARAAGVRFE